MSAHTVNLSLSVLPLRLERPLPKGGTGRFYVGFRVLHGVCPGNGGKPPRVLKSSPCPKGSTAVWKPVPLRWKHKITGDPRYIKIEVVLNKAALLGTKTELAKAELDYEQFASGFQREAPLEMTYVKPAGSQHKPTLHLKITCENQASATAPAFPAQEVTARAYVMLDEDAKYQMGLQWGAEDVSAMMDLDIAAVGLTFKGQVDGVCYYGRQDVKGRSKSQGPFLHLTDDAPAGMLVSHGGDEGEEDLEAIIVDLAQAKPNIAIVFFVVTVYEPDRSLNQLGFGCSRMRALRADGAPGDQIAGGYWEPAPDGARCFLVGCMFRLHDTRSHVITPWAYQELYTPLSHQYDKPDRPFLGLAHVRPYLQAEYGALVPSAAVKFKVKPASKLKVLEKRARTPMVEVLRQQLASVLAADADDGALPPLQRELRAQLRAQLQEGIGSDAQQGVDQLDLSELNGDLQTALGTLLEQRYTGVFQVKLSWSFPSTVRKFDLDIVVHLLDSSKNLITTAAPGGADDKTVPGWVGYTYRSWPVNPAQEDSDGDAKRQQCAIVLSPDQGGNEDDSDDSDDDDDELDLSGPPRHCEEEATLRFKLMPPEATYVVVSAILFEGVSSSLIRSNLSVLYDGKDTPLLDVPIHKSELQGESNGLVLALFERQSGATGPGAWQIASVSTAVDLSVALPSELTAKLPDLIGSEAS